MSVVREFRMLFSRRAVPIARRIIKRTTNEVNDSRRVVTKRCCISLAITIVVVLLACGCGGDEGKARRLYDEAMEQVKAGEMESAVATFEKIVHDFPMTEAASRASREMILYRGLDEAVRSFPAREAREMMVRIARALEKYRYSKGSSPKSLDALRPRYLSDPSVDPWGRAVLYERHGKGYVLACYGADGKAGGEGDARDWFVENGAFVRKPKRGMP